MEQTRKMVKIAYQALDEKKGEDIKIINLEGISVLADYFIIANGTNSSQVQTLVDNVEEELHKAGYSLKQREGVMGTGYFLISAILSFIYLIVKIVFSMISNESGEMEKKSLLMSYKIHSEAKMFSIIQIEHL